MGLVFVQRVYDARSVRIILVSTYELGHQPLHVASPAAALSEAGHEVRTVDLSVDRLDRGDLEWSDGLAFSVPMHTAMRLAVEAARAVKNSHPRLPICAYGLYAAFGPANQDSPFDHAVSGEYEQHLAQWANTLGREDPRQGSRIIDLSQTRFRVPFRSSLPALDRYAHLQVGGDHRKAGYVEASHGCRHRCRHCPIPAVYDGRVRVVDETTVLGDIAQLVEMGARHISFGDADFLNAPAHSLRVVRAMHSKHPRLTFDITTKVELILRHSSVWSELAACGLLFVVSAFETTNDHILDLLGKGHRAADETAAVRLLRSHGVEIRPTWLPFTPWTTADDLRNIVGFLAEHDLAGNVDPIQLTIRLLIPPGSLLLEVPDLLPYLDWFDDRLLGWRWHSAEPLMDARQARLVEILEHGLAGGLNNQRLFALLAGEIMGSEEYPISVAEGRPRLTEPWFC